MTRAASLRLDLDMARYVGEIAWETEVWVADAATYLFHFDGVRFLGPYPPRKWVAARFVQNCTLSPWGHEPRANIVQWTEV